MKAIEENASSHYNTYDSTDKNEIGEKVSKVINQLWKVKDSTECNTKKTGTDS